jgi:Uma2 family endonuclease
VSGCTCLSWQCAARISPGLLNERKGAIEARIVNVMKKAGTMRHDKLIDAVLEHTRRMNFVPPVDFVVEVIRSDIDKDFIEVVEDGANPLYRYQA